MAEHGFPWHYGRNRAVSLSEKQDVPDPNSGMGAVLEDATNNRANSISQPGDRERHKHLGSLKKKAHLAKSNGAAKPSVRFQEELYRSSTPVKPITRIPLRTIPPWVQDATEEDAVEAAQYLPDNPRVALVAQHHTSVQGQPREGGYPMSSGHERSRPTSRWISFARASAYPRENFNGEKVEPDWLNENWTDYSKAWLADHNDDDVEDGSDKYRAFRRTRRTWYNRAHHTVMRNPFIPLGFRLLVITFAAIAMGLGASIWHENRVITDCINQPMGQRTAYCASKVGQGPVEYDRDPSALMTIIVDAVSIIYSIYITYDEYFSKPLGLRPPAAKVRLVLLDLFFIVFQSATISLVFNSLHVVQGPCKSSTATYRFERVCARAEALSSMLLVSLIAWLLTFSVSILRLVERISTR